MNGYIVLSIQERVEQGTEHMALSDCVLMLREDEEVLLPNYADWGQWMRTAKMQLLLGEAKTQFPKCVSDFWRDEDDECWVVVNEHQPVGPSIGVPVVQVVQLWVESQRDRIYYWSVLLVGELKWVQIITELICIITNLSKHLIAKDVNALCSHCFSLVLVLWISFQVGGDLGL